MIICSFNSLPSLLVGDYTIIVSTFESGMTGNYTLNVASNIPFKVTPIPSEGAVSNNLYCYDYYYD